MTSSPSSVDVPDIVGPVVAWRVWTAEFNRLCSPQRGDIWEPGAWFTAECQYLSVIQEVEGDEPVSPHSLTTYGKFMAKRHLRAPFVPAPDCRCGIYVVAGQHHGHQRGFAAAPRRPAALVYGSVEIAGRYCQYLDGWRVERARVRALCDRTLRPHSRHLIRRLAADYDVPVIEGPMAEVSDRYFTNKGR